MKKLFQDKLIRKHFQKLFIQFLSISLLPLLLLYAAFSFILIPNERKNMESSTLTSLNLIKENVNLLFNDTSKIMNIIDSSVSSYALMQTFESDIEGYIGSYIEFLTCKQIAQQMSAIVNTRDYIESIYVYLPNSKNAYITNQMNIYHISTSPDKTWIEDVQSIAQNDIFRRHIAGHYYDTITITEQNSKGYIVAININASYFERMLSSMSITKGQKMLLTKDNIIASSSRNIDINERNSTLFSTQIDNYNCLLTSIIPNKELFSYEYNLLLVTIIISVICIIISLSASIYCSYRMTNRINDIITLLKNSSNSHITDRTKPYRNDVYGYITNHLIKTFLQNDYMKIALNEKKMELKVQELSALQYQINPHFLSNTLQMIDFEILKTVKAPCHANSMIEHLSRFLQYSLRSPDQSVLLWQEIKATKNYTELMLDRFQSQIEFQWNIDEKSLNIEVPKLILQPLIENSIQHNAQRLSTPLIIKIKAESTANETVISVCDNGIGITEEQKKEIQNRIKQKDFKENHIGLANIIRRLQLKYGENFSYSFNSNKDSKSGFIVSLRLIENTAYTDS